jgi:hypothetical protein
VDIVVLVRGCLENFVLDRRFHDIAVGDLKDERHGSVFASRRFADASDDDRSVGEAWTTGELEEPPLGTALEVESTSHRVLLAESF